MRTFLRHSGSLAVILVMLTACASAAEPAVPATANTATAITTTATVASTAVTVTATARLDRRAVMAGIVETVILPRHRELLREAELLEQAVAQFADQPTVETLVAAQAQWHSTAAAWAAIEPFTLRFTMLVTGQIKKWPINTQFIENFIATEATIDEPFIASIGSTAKGIGALEYLLFSRTLTNAEIVTVLTTTPPRLAYLVALAQNLPTRAAELYALWSPAGEQRAQALIDADFSEINIEGSISMLANELIVLIETMVKTKVEYPLRGMLADPQPQAVESPYAAASWSLLVVNLRTIQQIFHAGLGDYLDQMAVTPRTPMLSTAIDVQIEQTIAAIASITLPLDVAVLEDPAAVGAVRDHLKALLVLVKVDMANQLGITVTFSDNDGD